MISLFAADIRVIKEYFADYYLHRSDVTFDFSNKNEMIIHNNVAEPWRVTVVDTGLNTQTGARIKRVKDYIHGERFMLYIRRRSFRRGY